MTLTVMAAETASWIVLVAAGAALLRAALGPGTADRAVAMDMLSVLAVAFAGLRAVAAQEAAYLDAAAALALCAFLGTLAFARFIARRGRIAPEGGR